ncbi:hypothetical protein ACSNOI_33540 [Actinomadura kijaniata]|uniref:hypothetical protein n=1 Tax=Actinomadura kijaniata TaxID=46161 RepID=UPI003F1AA351
MTDTKDRLGALARHRYPDGIARVRALLEWAGIPAREPGGGLRWYDMAVVDLLLAEPADLVFAALAASSPTPAMLDGAAELFCHLKWVETHGDRLPEPVSAMLTRHIQSTGRVRPTTP